MDAVLSRLQTLSPDELREEITRAGLKCGPITATTRGIFEKKLARTLLEDPVGECTRSEVDGVEPRSSSDHAQSPPANSDSLRLDASPSTHVSEDATQKVSPESPSLFYGVLPPLDDPALNNGMNLRHMIDPKDLCIFLFSAGCPRHIIEDVLTNDPFIWLFFLTGVLHVYGDKQKALEAVMTMKGSRFKAFHNREDAENFAKGLNDGGVTPSKNSGPKLCTTSAGGFIHQTRPEYCSLKPKMSFLNDLLFASKRGLTN